MPPAKIEEKETKGTSISGIKKAQRERKRGAVGTTWNRTIGQDAPWWARHAAGPISFCTSTCPKYVSTCKLGPQLKLV